MINGHNHRDFSENMQRCHDYIKALEEERKKIQVFKRELPLCLELVTQAIETCKQQLSGNSSTEYYLHGQSGFREQTSSEDPIFKEFIPIKRPSSQLDSEKSKIYESSDCDNEGRNSWDKNCNKLDWLRSVQLWNQTPDPPSKEDSARKHTASEVKKKSERGVVGDGTTPPVSTSSTAENGGGNKKEEKESQRKARRCWSPELHRRFLQALQRLGGSHVATPKQIRELMKVDGLTNDEVKSHLQKYRLHTRRSIPSSQNNNAQTPHIVVEGLWMPPNMLQRRPSVASPPTDAMHQLLSHHQPSKNNHHHLKRGSLLSHRYSVTTTATIAKTAAFSHALPPHPPPTPSLPCHWHANLLCKDILLDYQW